jgi:IS30 family transposase
MRISHEAIYQSLYVQGRGAMRRELTAYLRTGRALRVPRARSSGQGKSFIVPEIMISERPAIDRLNARASHQPSHQLSADHNAVRPKHVAQHSAARK